MYNTIQIRIIHNTCIMYYPTLLLLDDVDPGYRPLERRVGWRGLLFGTSSGRPHPGGNSDDGTIEN